MRDLTTGRVLSHSAICLPSSPFSRRRLICSRMGCGSRAILPFRVIKKYLFFWLNLAVVFGRLDPISAPTGGQIVTPHLAPSRSPYWYPFSPPPTVVPLHNLDLPRGTCIPFGNGFVLQDTPGWIKVDKGTLADINRNDRNLVLDGKHALVAGYRAGE